VGPGPPPDWFDVSEFRASAIRRVLVREVERLAVVIGSTQPADVVVPGPYPVVRRRSGGGAVLVGPGDPLWLDVWIPRGDPRWQPDVGRAAWWVGEWWVAALAGMGATGLTVHRGGLVTGPWSDLVCFAGTGPGEVLSGGRKVVGVAQWRSREGALFHTAAYRHWDPTPLVERLRIDDRGAAIAALGDRAVGLEEVVPAVDRTQLIHALLTSFG
jgi:lipoate-protein ligase A